MDGFFKKIIDFGNFLNFDTRWFIIYERFGLGGYLWVFRDFWVYDRYI